ncbi:hypothetical protein CH372_20260, partial [Leptospira meyeri]
VGNVTTAISNPDSASAALIIWSMDAVSVKTPALSSTQLFLNVLGFGTLATRVSMGSSFVGEHCHRTGKKTEINNNRMNLGNKLVFEESGKFTI